MSDLSNEYREAAKRLEKKLEGIGVFDDPAHKQKTKKKPVVKKRPKALEKQLKEIQDTLVPERKQQEKVLRSFLDAANNSITTKGGLTVNVPVKFRSGGVVRGVGTTTTTTTASSSGGLVNPINTHYSVDMDSSTSLSDELGEVKAKLAQVLAEQAVLSEQLREVMTLLGVTIAQLGLTSK